MILNSFEGCSRSSSVSSVSQGTPVPLKSLLRDHNGGGWEGGQNPGATNKIKSPVDLTVVQTASATVPPSHLPQPCIWPPFSGAAGKVPVQWGWEGEHWENAHFTFCRRECFGQLGKKTSNPCPNCPNVWLLYFLQ